MDAPARHWLGTVPYLVALERQRARRTEVIAGSDREVLWGLEHPPVITTGRRAVDGLPSDEVLAQRGIARVATERGGLATYHGPGQLVGYLVVDIASRGIKVREMVYGLEQGVIDWLAAHGVDPGRRAGFPGVWVGHDKLCAVGLHFRKGVSMHGFALNLTVGLGPFELFTPCGVRDGGVSSLQALVGRSPTPEQAWPSVAEAVWAAVDSVRAGG